MMEGSAVLLAQAAAELEVVADGGCGESEGE